jgi:undecaprenyl phosphate N,N'-diacetylbacillosamine 1-phosphate transferase
MYIRIIKPLGDFIIAFVAIIVLIPMFILVAIAIKLNSPGSVFFLQERLGKDGRFFKIFKFRSMRTDIVSYKFGEVLTENNPQITYTGKFIRKTSIDEIPQLINILKGDMSFIGPRPPVTFYPKKYEDYTDFEKQRFSVKPGISGLAAVRQREINDWNKNIPVDVEYVQNISLLLDVKLFLVSLLAFFRTDNIYTKITQKTS